MGDYFMQAEDRIESLEGQLRMIRREKRCLKAKIERLEGQVERWKQEFLRMVEIRDQFVEREGERREGSFLNDKR